MVSKLPNLPPKGFAIDKSHLMQSKQCEKNFDGVET